MADWHQAVYYRTRAETLRSIAKEMANREHRRVLNETARYFDDLAASLEQQARKPAAPS